MGSRDMRDLLKLAEAVVSSARINYVKQTMGEFKIVGNGAVDKLDQSINVVHEIDDEEENEITTECQFKLIGIDSGNQDQQVLMISANFSASYNLENSFDAKEVDAFARVGGAYNCWPFWREYIHQACCRLQITPLTAPLMTAAKFAKLVAKDPKED